MAASSIYLYIYIEREIYFFPLSLWAGNSRHPVGPYGNVIRPERDETPRKMISSSSLLFALFLFYKKPLKCLIGLTSESAEAIYAIFVLCGRERGREWGKLWTRKR